MPTAALRRALRERIDSVQSLLEVGPFQTVQTCEDRSQEPWPEFREDPVGAGSTSLAAVARDFVLATRGQTDEDHRSDPVLAAVVARWAVWGDGAPVAH